MRRTIVIITVAAATLFSCTSPEKKAQKLIKQQLKETLNNPKSYEPVNFGSLDSLMEEEFTKEYTDISVKYHICQIILRKFIFTQTHHGKFSNTVLH